MESVTIYGTCLLILLIAILFTYNHIKNRRSNELIKKIPSLNYNVINLLMLIFKYWIRTKDSSQAYFDMFHDIAKKFEKEGIFTVSTYPFTNPIIFITSPKYYKDILTNQDNIFKNVSYEFLVGMIGRRNLIMSGGDVWKHDRRIINSSFKYSKIMSLNGRISKRADMLISTIIESDYMVNNMHPHLANMITHVILESAIGRVIDPKDKDLLDYIEGQRKYSDSLVIQAAFPIFFVFPPLFYNTIGLPVKHAVRRIKRFISDAVDQRIDKVLSSADLDNNCLSDTLIQAHLSDPISVPKDVIIDHVTTFVFVGHKATSYTLNAILFLLASHPDKQKKLQEEIDANFDRNHIDDEILDNDRLNRCSYLLAVIKEGQRMYPISATIGRRVTKEFKCNEYDIPIGAEILFDFNSLSKHPEAFPYRPHEFIPERFILGSAEYDDHRHPFSFLPFSHGLRKCIGEKFAMNILKIFLVKLLIKFDLSTKLEMSDIKLVQDIMVYIRTPIDIKFTERIRSDHCLDFEKIDFHTIDCDEKEIVDQKCFLPRETQG